jgi:hypothetical protein
MMRFFSADVGPELSVSECLMKCSLIFENLGTPWKAVLILRGVEGCYRQLGDDAGRNLRVNVEQASKRVNAEAEPPHTW